jgi:hypothetical protein
MSTTKSTTKIWFGIGNWLLQARLDREEQTMFELFLIETKSNIISTLYNSDVNLVKKLHFNHTVLQELLSPDQYLSLMLSSNHALPLHRYPLPKLQGHPMTLASGKTRFYCRTT